MIAATTFIREMTHADLLAADPKLSDWLVGEPGYSLLDTYPQIFGEGAGVCAFGAYDRDELRSHAAVRRVTLVTSLGDVRASLVGVVATDPDARGAQLASGILHRIADREMEAEQDMIILWSDLWGFYAKLGYAISGVQAEITIAQPGEPRGICRSVGVDDLEQLTALHAQKPWRIERNREEMERLVMETHTQGFVLEREGSVAAYAFHGKGVDFQGWWHEFGGLDEDVATLLPGAMLALDQPEATVLIPPYRNDLLELLVPYGSTLKEGAVALCKPLTERGRCEFFIDGLDSV